MNSAVDRFRTECGQALVVVLVLMAAGGLMLPPLLGLVSTSLKLAEVHTTSLMEFYAADAGIEDALWQIKADQLETLFPDYDRYAFSEDGALRYWYSDYPGTASTRSVNGKTVDVGVENVWIPQGIAVPSPSEAQQVIDDARLIVTGGMADADTYRIRLTYNYDDDADPGGQDLTVDLVGVWLPPGFTYVADSSTLEDDDNSIPDYYCVPSVSAYKSGQAIVWDFSPDLPFIDLPGQPSGYPLIASISFDFTSSGGSVPDAAVSWLSTSGVSGVDYAWDADVRVFKLTSVATDPASGTSTTVESYTARKELRRISGAIAGDYYATGNSLLTSTDYNDDYRNRLYKESDANIPTDESGDNGIPTQALVEAAFLYWTGWIDWHDYDPGSESLFYDNCYNWDSPPTNWSHGGQWDLNYGRFRGQGGGTATARRLTMSNSLDLSAYEPGTVTISWDQSEYQSVWWSSLSSTEGLFYAFSGDGGATWSTNYTAFLDDNPPSSFSTMIPADYLTADFRVRFYFNFDSTSEYVYLDNITITHSGASLVYPDNPTTENLTALIEDAARTSVVLLEAGGSHPVEVTANAWEIEPTTGTEWAGTWSYCCFADVTELVHQWIDDGDLNNNASGTYTLGHKTAANEADPTFSEALYVPVGPNEQTGYPLGSPAPYAYGGYSGSPLRYQYSHAGWSLVVIYTSPVTKGHQLFLFDIQDPNFDFTEAWAPAGNPNPDFDGDGNPGGSISGFLVPEPIEGETIAARMTVFVGEGDSGIQGDQALMNDINLSNPSSPWNNVWNSASPGMSVSGVDIDTFIIEWDDGILEPGASSAQVDLPTTNDGFNLVYIILSFRSDVKSGGTIGFVLPT